MRETFQLLRFLSLPKKIFASDSALLGLDMGQDALKLVELGKKRGGIHVLHFGIMPLPSGVIEQGEVKDTTLLSEKIKELLGNTGVTTENVAISVPNLFALTKVVSVDSSLSDIEIENYLLLHFERYFPFPVGEAYFDFSKLGPSKQPGNTDILCCVCKTEKIEPRILALLKADLKPRIVDLEPYALKRACSLVHADIDRYKQNRALVFADVGRTQLTLYVFDKEYLIYCRSEAIGGQLLIEKIKAQLSLTSEECFTALQENYLPKNFENQVARPFIELLSGHLVRAIRLFLGDFPQYVPVSRVVLTGGVFMLPGARETIAKTLGCSVEITNPFVHMASVKDGSLSHLLQYAPLYSLACGLAQRAFDDD